MREAGGNEVKRAGTAGWEAKGISGERREGLGWHEGKQQFNNTFGGGEGGAERASVSTCRLHRSRLTGSVEFDGSRGISAKLPVPLS